MTFDSDKPRRGRVGLYLSAALIGVVVLAGIGVGIVLAVRGPADTSPASPVSPAPSSSTSDASTTEGACGPVAYQATNTMIAAPATTWVPWSATILATSPEVGPAKNTDGVRTCYARTPAGALFAAYNFAQYCADTTVLPSAVRAIYADGPGKATVVAQAATSQACPPSGPYVAGYRIASYDGQTATIYVAVDAPQAHGAAGVQMRWQDGDWKVVTDAQGNSPVAPVPLDSMVGYTTWGPGHG